MTLYEMVTRARYGLAATPGHTAQDVLDAVIEKHGEDTLQGAIADAVAEVKAKIAERTNDAETAAAAFRHLVGGTVPDGMDRSLFKIVARVRRRNEYTVQALQWAYTMNLLGGENN